MTETSFLYISLAFLALSIGLWMFYTMPFLEKQFNETLGVPSNKVPVAFVLDAIKALHLLNVHNMPVPFAIQVHVISLVLSFIFIIGYVAKLDGLI